MEQLLILLFIGAIFFAKTFVKKLSEGTQDQGEQPPASRPRTPGTQIARQEDEQERLRNFMEALGLPSDAEPPPPPPVVRRSAQEEHARGVVRQFPPRPAMAARTMRQEQQPLRLRRSGAAFIPPSLPKLAPSAPSVSPSSGSPKEAYGLTSAAEVQAQSLIPTNAATDGIMPGSPSGGSPVTEKCPAALRDLLSTPASLRSAVVLREILGPPRSLQPLRPFAGL